MNAAGLPTKISRTTTAAVKEERLREERNGIHNNSSLT